MDALVAKVSQEAVKLVVRSSISYTWTLALKQYSQVAAASHRIFENDTTTLIELERLQTQLNGRISIVSPAIDLIELRYGDPMTYAVHVYAEPDIHRSSRGSPSLVSALPIASALRHDIANLVERLRQAAADLESAHLSSKSQTELPMRARLREISADIRSLVSRIDCDIPLLHLAISASGESLSSTLSSGTSPSRFLQASAFLNFGDTQFASDPTRAVQIGPAFSLSLYMLFVGHADPLDSRRGTFEPSRAEQYGIEENARKPLWQEVFHKARVRLCRTPVGWDFCPLLGYKPATTQDSAQSTFKEYSYHIEMVEDLDDGRMHADEEATQGPYDKIRQAGIRESLPIPNIAKIFYADTGRLLNIGADTAGSHSPVLLLKRDMTVDEGAAPDTALENEQDEIDRQLCEEMLSHKELSYEVSKRLRFPSHLDPEWMAFEIWEDDTSDIEDGEGPECVEGGQGHTRRPRLGPSQLENQTVLDDAVMDQMRSICLDDTEASEATGSTSTPPTEQSTVSSRSFVARSPFAGVTTSLSLLEMLIRLTSLQQSQQAHHLTTSDAVLTFFLEEASTTGLSGEERWRARNAAKQRVGFDPYMDSSEDA